MSTAWEVRSPTEVRVVCPVHGMDKTVDPNHAANLINYHNRNDHPGGNWVKISVADILAGPQEEDESFHIREAAEALLLSQSVWNTDDYRNGALLVWQGLTGLAGPEAIAKARELAQTTTVAHQPPF